MDSKDSLQITIVAVRKLMKIPSGCSISDRYMYIEIEFTIFFSRKEKKKNKITEKCSLSAKIVN